MTSWITATVTAAALLAIPIPSEQDDAECAAGDLAACAVKGGRLLTEGKFDEGLALLQSTCDRGEPVACYNLAVARVRGTGGSPNVPAAVGLFEQACKQGFSMACSDLGHLYATGNGVPQDPAKAYLHTAQGCEAGLPAACSEQASMMVSGFGTTEDPQGALTVMTGACEAGHGISCSKVAALYAQGIVGTGEEDTSVWDAKACEHGDAIGCFNHGAGLRRAGKLEEAYAVDTRGCSLGVGESCAALGMAHLKGRGAPEDTAAALGQFEKACDLGYSRGCTAAGATVSVADTSPEAPARAEAFFRRACELGDTNACEALERKAWIDP